MKRIAWWTIEVEWADGTREKVSEIPQWVANPVDEFLTSLEEERNKEGESNAN